MSREFPNVRQTDYIDTGLLDLLKRDVSALSSFSGEGTPSNAPQGTFYDDTVNGVLACDGNTIIDYRNGYETSANLAAKYQPVNEELTKYASVTVPSTGGLLCNTSVIAMSSYFRLLNLTSVSAFKNSLELGTLANKSVVKTEDFIDFTLQPDKFEEPLLEDAPFKTGDILYSLSNAGKAGWIRLEDNVTLGGELSGAVYRGATYKNLYTLMWERTDTVCYTMTGDPAEKGVSADADWSANKRLTLPSKRSLFNGPTNTIIVETTAEISKTLTLQAPGYYEIYVVTGGGGSASSGSGGKGSYTSGEYPPIGGE